MKLYAGHYAGNPKEWFLVYAESKEGVFDYIDGNYGEPDMDTVKEVHGEVAINFAVSEDSTKLHDNELGIECEDTMDRINEAGKE